MMFQHPRNSTVFQSTFICYIDVITCNIDYQMLCEFEKSFHCIVESDH